MFTLDRIEAPIATVGVGGTYSRFSSMENGVVADFTTVKTPTTRDGFSEALGGHIVDMSR